MRPGVPPLVVYKLPVSIDAHSVGAVLHEQASIGDRVVRKDVVAHRQARAGGDNPIKGRV